ncbi:GNAT family N-acetyltransferase [Rhizobium halophytocola]|uniref:GNAT superfamily N-acetyltransferase n=1 Tax=Rhizobium halophytocola TaxID=735519 RepID=A0ABS4E0J3_9HYPH|nr:GNAT family N-acetyltransferase [Rhizobium halophytocola]MBP1851455.1 GNAT superfamily N-acetyltransferase [Rhizobium halophytocola]
MPIADAHLHRTRIAAGLTWVSTDASGRPLGFITIERHDDTIHIAELSVGRAAQGHGHGRALMDAVIAAAMHSGAAAITLTTFRDVAWNRPFYERLGFSIVDDRTAGPRLIAVLQAEAQLGFDPATRCAMRRLLRG